ncbi:MurR/RpiR family transcriptional regulator [Microvirga lenta]|uniref:MurR/RpiR family transcriptional regulator n=1 Tax=Microvirga lenta TaxID=2881337 RepID=UPI001CFFCA21|nr:MurR/RpiR family transcriptional regulator [Microvirga lenta]MCB5175111.1 MurR/RpiR family transcriptional regulator [Microvirga lenta]
MDPAPLTAKIIAAFPDMPAQLQTAARYVLESPDDVALLSMREQARRAGVQPATMTRLAKRLGLAGYDDIRDLYAQAIREGGLSFAGKAGAQVASQKAKGEQALAAEMVASLTAQISRLGEPEALERLSRAATLLASAHRIYCLGLRSSHPVAWHMTYVLSLLGEKAVLLDAVAGVGADPIRMATDKDALFAVSVAPYTRATIDMARYARTQGIPIVAITDSAVSPLAQVARIAVLVSTEGPSFFHAITPAFVVGEILAALVAGQGGEASLQALRRTEDQLTAFNIHWSPQDDRRT